MAQSDALAAHVRLRAEKLEHLSHRIVSCHVVVGLAGHHHRHGDRYQVSINLGLPGREILVDHTPNEHSLETARSTSDRAFEEAERQLEDWVRRERVQRHGGASKRESSRSW
jgi:ribosome-associated translation inhibitor RaiA